jgi:hypothetical protein
MWTVEKITTHFGQSVTEDTAREILAILRGDKSPLDVPKVAEWARQCYHSPKERAPETIMLAFDALLETYGTEAIWAESSCTKPVAEYCNSGDTYTATILYDYRRGKFCLTSFGDWIERYGERYGVN